MVSGARWSYQTAKALILSGSKTTRAIPFFNILWAELSDFDLTVHYAQQASKSVVQVASFNYLVEKSMQNLASSWVSKLLHYAYGVSRLRKRIKILINPVGGKGSAQKWYNRDIEPILAAARCDIDVERTQYQGHAVEIAEKLDADAYDVVAACSGDGLPHEIFNGLGKRQDARRALSKIAVVQLPCGSANALCLSLNGTDSPSMAALALVKGIRTPLDLVSITQGNRRILSFLSQSFGIIAECDLGTDHLRWMGSLRFTWGYLVRLLGKTVYPCDIAVKVEIATKPEIRDHCRAELSNSWPVDRHHTVSPDESSFQTQEGDGLPPLRYGTINDPLPPGWTLLPAPTLSNFWCGNMPYMSPSTNIFPASLPADGHADLVTIDGDISRLAAVRAMLAAGEPDGAFFDLDQVRYRKISGYRLVPARKGGCVSIDGERIPCEPWQAEVHRGLGVVLSRRGRYEVGGVLEEMKRRA